MVVVVAGVVVVGAGAAGAIPVAWNMLHEYQRARIMTFLNPENDPLGTGYHILQSKIALGSGGLFGKGYMLGSQSHLNFLPEKQTATVVKVRLAPTVVPFEFVKLFLQVANCSRFIFWCSFMALRSPCAHATSLAA